MNLIIKINLDNAAFATDSEAELENVLEQVQQKLEVVTIFYPQLFPIRDTNGNTVGTVEVTE